jgi:hypothetical protein
MPEGKLAREAEICYVTVAMVTDFDCWHPDHDAVTAQNIIKVLTANAEKVKRPVARLAQDFPREHEPCPIGSDRALDNAIITVPGARDPDLLKKLDCNVDALRIMLHSPAHALAGDCSRTTATENRRTADSAVSKLKRDNPARRHLAARSRAVMLPAGGEELLPLARKSRTRFAQPVFFIHTADCR